MTSSSEKDRYRASYGTRLDLILKEKNVDTVLIIGAAFNVCCESPGRDGFFLNHRVLSLDHCNATRNGECDKGPSKTSEWYLVYALPSMEPIADI